MLEEGGYLTSEEVDGKRFIRLQRVADLSDRNQQSDSRNTYDSFVESKL